jgi:hypothetical protein
MTDDEFLIGDWPNVPASTRSWPRFHVTLEDAHLVGYDGVAHDEHVLCERADQPVTEARLQKPTAVFERFLALADEDDLAVLNFASQHGTLGLCRHGVPMTVIPSRMTSRSCTRHHCRVVGSSGQSLLLEGEHPAHWRRLARQFLAAIEIASGLRNGRVPPRSAVDRLLEGADHFDDVDNLRIALLGGFGDGPPPPISDLGELKDRETDIPRGLGSRQVAALRDWYFRGWINHWLTPLTAPPLVTGQLSPQPSFQMEAGMPDLFSTLALQLALIVTKTRSFVLCDNCHLPTEHHRASAGNRAWCTRPECRRAKARLESKRHRDKRRAQSQVMLSGRRSA